MKTESMGKRVIRTVIVSLLLLLFSASLSLGLLTLAGGSVLSYECILDATEKTEYTEKLRAEIRDSFESIGRTTGIPSSLTDAFLDECVSDEDLLLPVRQMNTDETLTHDVAAWKQEFCRRLEDYAATLQESGELELTEEEWEQMKASFAETSTHFIGEITDSVRLSGLYSVVGSVMRLMERLKPYVLISCAAFVLLSAVLLVSIGKKNAAFFAYAGFLASGLLFLVPALVLQTGAYVARLRIEPFYLRDLLVWLSDVCLERLAFVGMLLCAAGLLFGAVTLVLMLVRNRRGSSSFEKSEGEMVE